MLLLLFTTQASSGSGSGSGSGTTSITTTNRSVLSIKMAARFPAMVTADTGIAVSTTGGVYNFAFDFPSLALNTSIATPSNWVVLVYNTSTETYSQARLDSITDNAVSRTGSSVAGLPAAGNVGNRRHVTDATASTYSVGTPVAGTGGGSNVLPVFDNGTAWVYG